MATVTSTTAFLFSSVGRSCMKTNPVLKESQASPTQEFRSMSSLGGNISPSTTVSELSVDSGVVSEEDLDEESEDPSETYEDCPLYENIEFHSKQNKKSLLQMTAALSIECGGPAPPPPAQFADEGLITTTERSDTKVEKVCCSISKGTPYPIDVKKSFHRKDIGLILTTQNQSTIDVKTLQRSKVSKSNFTTYCLNNQRIFRTQNDDPMELQGLRPEKRNILSTKKEETILSVKGTVRGVKNRVRAGIATFLQEQDEKDYLEKEEGQCVLYVSSLGVVRETKARCSSVRKILRNLCVRTSERDVFMSREHFYQLTDRLSMSDQIPLPQVFLHGQLLGVSRKINTSK